MNYIKVLFFLCASVLSISAQDFIITNGKNTTAIKKGSLLELSLYNSRLSNRSECSCMGISGTMINHTKDSLTIRLSYFGASFDKIDLGLTSNIDFSKGDLQQQYAISDIITLRKYKSQKQQNRKSTFGIFGGLFITTGLVTVLQFPLAKKRQGRKNLLISGSAQLVTGLTLVGFAHKKTYPFRKNNSGTEDPWRVK